MNRFNPLTPLSNPGYAPNVNSIITQNVHNNNIYSTMHQNQMDKQIPHSKIKLPKNSPFPPLTSLREFKADAIQSSENVIICKRPDVFKRQPVYHVNDLLSHEELKEKNKKDGFNPENQMMTWAKRLDKPISTTEKKVANLNPYYTGVFHSCCPKKRHTPTRVYFPVLTFEMGNDLTPSADWLTELEKTKKIELKIPDAVIPGGVIGNVFPNLSAVLLSVHLLEEHNTFKIPFDLVFSCAAYSGNGRTQHWTHTIGPNPNGELSNKSSLHYTTYPDTPPTRYTGDAKPVLWMNSEETVNNAEFSRWINEPLEEIQRLLIEAGNKSKDPVCYWIRCPDKEATTFSNMLQFLVVDEFRRIGNLSLELKPPALLTIVRDDEIDYFSVSRTVIEFLVKEKFEVIANKDDHIISFRDLTLTLTPTRLKDNKWIEELRKKLKVMSMKNGYLYEFNSYPTCSFKLQLCCEPYEGTTYNPNSSSSSSNINNNFMNNNNNINSNNLNTSNNAYNNFGYNNNNNNINSNYMVDNNNNNNNQNNFLP
jgi:hypothetical protein